MKLKILAILCLGMLPLFAIAQTDTLVYYLNDRMQYLGSKEGAAVIRMVIKPVKPEKYYTVHDFYMNGKTRVVAKSNKDDGSVLQGPFMGYNQNGKRSFFGNYKDGYLQGDFTSYYNNGNIRTSGKIDQRGSMLINEYRDSTGKIIASGGKGQGIEYAEPPLSYTDTGPIENGRKNGEWRRMKNDTLKCKLFYQDDNLQLGIGFDDKGNGYEFHSFNEYPRYKGDYLDLYNHIRQKVALPKEAKANKTSGFVTLNFNVHTDGTIADIEITEGLGYGIDEQVLSMFKQIQQGWLPGKEYGIPIESRGKFSVQIGN